MVPYRLEGRTSGAQDFIQVNSAIPILQCIDDVFDYRLDLVAYPILEPPRARDRQHLLSRCAKLPPTGDWLERFLTTDVAKNALASGETLLAQCVGYPECVSGTNIKYGIGGVGMEISTQLVVASGKVVWSSIEHCLRLEGVTWHDDLSGFSGAPVFARLPSEHGPQFALIGMIICGSSNHVSFIRVGTLVKALGAVNV